MKQALHSTSVICVLTTLLLFANILLLAQAPHKMSYQAVIRDADNELVTNSNVGMQISILQGSADGSAVYVETHLPTTNANGLVSLEIGGGTVVSGDLADVDWADGPYFIKTETDPMGGESYSITATSQLLSVPYALYAETGGTPGPPGEDGVGIDHIEDNEDGTYTFVLTDGTSYTTSDLTGPIGETGIGIDTVEDNEDGTFTFYFTDNSSFTTPDFTGPEGPMGPIGNIPDGLYPGDFLRWDGQEWVLTDPYVPVVITKAASNITENSATCGGNVIQIGSTNVTTRGLVWSTSTLPTLQENEGSATSGSGSGEYSINLTGLIPETKYFIRSYAANAQGLAYGNQVIFTTTASTIFLPSVSTNAVTGITQTTAISGGEVTDDGGDTVTARGVIWNTNSAPTFENNDGMTNDGSGIGSFTSEITGLDPNTTYYLRAYAVNSQGIKYGNQEIFSTLSDPNLPTVITAEISLIGQNSAVSGGEITDPGAGEVLLRGVCYSTSENPTVDDNFTQDGEGAGSFVSEMTNLLAATTYFVRAFASSTAGGIGYGNQLSFTTLTGPPSLEITSINSGQPGFRKIDAIVIHDGDQEVTERGFVWHIAGNPTLEDNLGFNTEGAGLGEFTSDLTDLIPNTINYVRAYATNSEGTGYSNQVSFNFWDYHDTVTDIDGNIYYTVLIGEQEWMAENLKTTKYSNGVPIEYPGNNNAAWNDNTSGAYAWYDNDLSWKNIYGALYNWYAVNNENALCPIGWRVPSDNDWTELENYVVNQGYPNSNVTYGTGNTLKSCRQINSPFGGECDTSEHPRWNSHGTHHGFDEFGFSALPGGVRWFDGSFLNLGTYSYWWLSIEHSSSLAWFQRMQHSYGSLSRHNVDKSYGFSLRCVRNLD